MFFNKINIRWSDLDPNQHLANSAYMNFMSATRIMYMLKKGVSYGDLKELGLGPIILREEVHYFQEVFPGEPVYISQEMSGISEDKKFFNIRHNFYDKKGNNFARGQMMGTWIDMKSRKIVELPSDIYEKLTRNDRSEDFKILTKEEIRLVNMQPKAIDLKKELG